MTEGSQCSHCGLPAEDVLMPRGHPEQAEKAPGVNPGPFTEGPAGGLHNQRVFVVEQGCRVTVVSGGRRFQASPAHRGGLVDQRNCYLGRGERPKAVEGAERRDADQGLRIGEKFPGRVRIRPMPGQDGPASPVGHRGHWSADGLFDQETPGEQEQADHPGQG